MAVHCEYIDLIIPIEKIDLVYPGGFNGFKRDNDAGFSSKLWHDEFLLRDGAMNSRDINSLVAEWERLGLQGKVEISGEMQWVDFCVFSSLYAPNSTFPKWLEFDKENNCVYLKGQPKGDVIGPKWS